MGYDKLATYHKRSLLQNAKPGIKNKWIAQNRPHSSSNEIDEMTSEVGGNPDEGFAFDKKV